MLRAGGFSARVNEVVTPSRCASGFPIRCTGFTPYCDITRSSRGSPDQGQEPPSFVDLVFDPPGDLALLARARQNHDSTIDVGSARSRGNRIAAGLASRIAARASSTEGKVQAAGRGAG